jgi:hypothetical protein
MARRHTAALATLALVILTGSEALAQHRPGGTQNLFSLPYTVASAALGSDPPPAARTLPAAPRAPERAAQVQGNPEASRAAFERGVRFADELAWQQAAEAFEESYRLYPRPGTLYNLGLAHRALGRYTRAIDELQRFLQEGSPSADVRAQVEQVIGEMRQNLAHLTITPSVANATITLDEQPVTAGEVIDTDPGNHVVSVTAPGFTRNAQTVTLARGETRQLDVQLERAGGGILSQWWLWTAVGVVVAGGVAASVVLLSHEAAPDCGLLNVCITP